MGSKLRVMDGCLLWPWLKVVGYHQRLLGFQILMSCLAAMVEAEQALFSFKQQTLSGMVSF